MKAKHEFETDTAYRKYLKVYFAAIAMQGDLCHEGTSLILDLDKRSVRWVEAANALIKELFKT